MKVKSQAVTKFSSYPARESPSAVSSLVHRGSRYEAAEPSVSPWSEAQGSETEDSQPCLLTPVEGDFGTDTAEVAGVPEHPIASSCSCSQLLNSCAGEIASHSLLSIQPGKIAQDVAISSHFIEYSVLLSLSDTVLAQH